MFRPRSGSVKAAQKRVRNADPKRRHLPRPDPVLASLGLSSGEDTHHLESVKAEEERKQIQCLLRPKLPVLGRALQDRRGRGEDHVQKVIDGGDIPDA